MKPNRIVALGVLIALFTGCQQHDYTQYVNPFVGTLHEGHCFPGATRPMSMVQVSPESTTDPYDGYAMDHVAGYQYSDKWLAGFTQTHLNGAGCPSLSDILLMPYCVREIDPMQRENFRSGYDKRSEVATPGYYGVRLTDNRTAVELTATSHVALHRYVFDDSASARVLLDLQYGVGWEERSVADNVLEAEQQIDDYTICGHRKARIWAERDLFYVLKFDHKITKAQPLAPPMLNDERAPRYILEFALAPDRELNVQIALSTVSVDAAKANLRAEIGPKDDFDAIRDDARCSWNDVLSKVEFEGEQQKKILFYTALYHLYIQPNNIADVDGHYRAANDSICKNTSGKFYSTLSLWDTFRATHPLYTILTPSIVGEIATSMLDSYANMPVDSLNPREANRYLPRWALWGKETHTMIGNHAVPVLVDAWLKGIKPVGYDDETLYAAIWESVTQPHYRNHTDLIDTYGYIPYDVQLSTIDDGRETVSRLLEGIYDDHCAAQLAAALHKTEDNKFLSQRATYYRNIYDPTSGFMRGRNAKGIFKSDVDVNQVVGEWLPGSDFTEGNAWHYLFHVQHDLEGLKALMGGESVFRNKLDSLFYSQAPKPYVKDLVWNIDGLLGQYWHGNEPCHHVPYLYKCTTQGYKTDAIIKFLVDTFSVNTPDGLKGNDDCGQMSAWYMFAVMGFYPVNPCGGEFIIGAPQTSKVILQLENGQQFMVEAPNISDANMFVDEVALNGVPLSRNYITYAEIMQGGRLTFTMTSRADAAELMNFKTE